MTSSNKELTRKVIFVTGMSGAGKSTALKVLEDYGFEAVDNLPLSLLANLILPGDDGGPVAIGIDVRTRDFSAGPLIQEINRSEARRSFASSWIPSSAMSMTWD
jgi:UPF0042 nucleotide-binding protein